MNYDQTLKWLYAQLPAFSRIGAPAYKPGLDNTLALSVWLGQPEKRFRSIHVAGTNGKGSVSHMLASVLQAAGYKVGLYTSPHLKDFRERIRIDGRPCSEDFIVEFVRRYRAAGLTVAPSFFELTVAMAFDLFASEKVDIAVIETGLGGRLDSTNIIYPLLSIITNIGLDHMQFLGNTLEAIAAEKAGIIKAGLPVVIGEKQAETTAVFVEKAALEGASLLWAEDAWKINLLRQGAEFSLFEATHQNGRRLELQLDLGGIYQRKNLAAVLTALDCLPASLTVSDEALTTGLKQVKSSTGLHGRWECLGQRPFVYADVAHNEPGMRELLNQISIIQHKQLHLVTGFVKDKAIDSLLRMMPATALFYFTQAKIERALPAVELQKQGSELGLSGQVYEDVNQALSAARANAEPDDLIVVCGSIFLVGELDAIRV